MRFRFLCHRNPFDAPAIGARLPALRQAMGLPGGADVADAIVRLDRDPGLPQGPSGTGLRREHPTGIAAASRDRSTAPNARPIGEDDDATLPAEALWRPADGAGAGSHRPPLGAGVRRRLRSPGSRRPPA